MIGWRGILSAGLVVMACGGGREEGSTPTYSAGAIVVTRPVAWRTVADGPVTIGFQLQNRGAAADVLLAARAEGTTVLDLHDAGSTGMIGLDSLQVPARARITLGVGGPHLMGQGLEAAVGDTLIVELVFVGAGVIEVAAPVLRFTEARQLLAP